MGELVSLQEGKTAYHIILVHKVQSFPNIPSLVCKDDSSVLAFHIQIVYHSIISVFLLNNISLFCGPQYDFISSFF